MEKEYQDRVWIRSRIDGSLKLVDNKTLLNGGIVGDEFSKAFGLMSNILAENEKQREQNNTAFIPLLSQMTGIGYDVVKRVFDVFESEVDPTNQYLLLMEGAETETPSDVWETWCRNTGAEHEIDCNPFIEA